MTDEQQAQRALTGKVEVFVGDTPTPEECGCGDTEFNSGGGVTRPSFCSTCPISQHTTGYVPLKLRGGDTLLVGEASGENERDQGLPFVGGAGAWLRGLCRSANQNFDDHSIVNVIGCQPKHNIFPTDPKWTFTSRKDGFDAVEHCRKHHLLPAITRANKQRYIALGNQALKALTGKVGIETWRGSPLQLITEPSKGPQVIPTIHPAALMRQAKLTSVVVGDLRKSLKLPPERYNLYPTEDQLRAFNSTRFAFDFEWDRAGNITLCGLSDKHYTAIVVPFDEPYVDILRGIFERATELIGHNIISADIPYITRMGWDISRAEIHDTILKQHLIQPDYPHGLNFVASVFTNKVFWKGKGDGDEDQTDGEQGTGAQWRTWDNPNAIHRSYGGYGGCRDGEEAFRLYNARDTDAEYQINLPLSTKLKQYNLEHIYNHVSVPIAFLCEEMGSKGFRLDTTRLGEIRERIDQNIEELESKLPGGLKPYETEVSCNLPAPPGTYKTKTKTCKGPKGHKHEPVSITFTIPGPFPCSVCGREVPSGPMGVAKIIKGKRRERVVPYNSTQKVQDYANKLKLKAVYDSKTGNKTSGKKARGVWAKEHPEFVLLGALKEEVTLRNNFAKDSLLGQERMYFRLNPFGTSEGRLSSTGQRKGIDLNIQNQPEEFRIIYVPDREGWGILNLDISQGESQLTTWLAKDWDRWERIQDVNYDEHCDLASRIFGRTISKTKEDKPFRDIGKKINHGRNYGMGVKKQLEELLSAGFDSYTQADVKEFIEIWKTMNRRTAEWQKETIERATSQGYLTNPFGRKRWFGRNVATESLAFLPASTLADMVLRFMLCHYPNDPRIGPSVIANKMKVYAPLVDGWEMRTQVHDSLVFQGPDETHREQAERSNMIMCQPFDELDGFRFHCDIKYSTRSWGDCETIKI